MTKSAWLGYRPVSLVFIAETLVNTDTLSIQCGLFVYLSKLVVSLFTIIIILVKTTFSDKQIIDCLALNLSWVHVRVFGSTSFDVCKNINASD